MKYILKPFSPLLKQEVSSVTKHFGLIPGKKFREASEELRASKWLCLIALVLNFAGGFMVWFYMF